MQKSTLPPHAAGVWVPCPGSIALTEKFPRLPLSDDQNESRREGRAFHELAEIMLRAKIPSMPDMVGIMSSHGIPYSDEMHEAAELYVGDVLREAGDVEPRIEHRVDMPNIIGGMYGYLDVSIFKDRTNFVIYDAKYGHKYVEVFENWQLLTYAAAICREWGVNVLDYPDMCVTLRIVQPRSYHNDGPIRDWVVPIKDLYEYEKKIKQSATEAMSNNPTCHTGTHCGNCDAARACGALAAANYAIVDYVTDTQGLELNGANLSIEYKKLSQFKKLLEARLDDLETQLTHAVQNGETGLLHTGEMGYGRVKWDKPAAEIIALASMYGVSAIKTSEPQLITPAQLIKKGVDASVIKEYSVKPKTGVKLVEVNSVNMRKIFKQQNER